VKPCILRVMDVREHSPIPTPKIFIALEVRDQSGKVIHRRRERGHSWVRNYYKILVAHAGFVSNNADMDLRLQRENGGWIGTNDVWTLWDLDKWKGGSGDTGKGILIGTGTTPPTIDDYKLEAKIPHGSGEGQMIYNAQEPHQHETISGGWRTTMVRQFNNNSGASIYVTETGIEGTVATPGLTQDNVLVCRNVHDPAVEVPHGGLLTVTYVIEVTEPW